MSPAKRTSKRPVAGSQMDKACLEVMSNVEGAVACGVVDLATGELLGFHALRRTPALEEAVRAATVALLCRGVAGKGGAARVALEAHVVSEHGHHFAKVFEGGKAAVMLVTTRLANAGMGSAQFKAVLPKVEPYVP